MNYILNFKFINLVKIKIINFHLFKIKIQISIIYFIYLFIILF